MCPFPSRRLYRFDARGVPKNEKTEISELVGKILFLCNFAIKLIDIFCQLPVKVSKFCQSLSEASLRKVLGENVALAYDL